MPLWLRCITAGAAALPLVACFARRRPGQEAWLISAAFAVSLLIEVVSYLVRQSGGHGNAWVGYVGYPVQFALLVLAVAKDPPAIGIGLGGVILLAMGSSAVPLGITASGQALVIPQEVMLRGLAGLGIAGLAWENPAFDRFRGPVMLYTLTCLPFVIGMALLPRTLPAWLWVWAGYQAVRLTALLWTTAAVLRGDEPARDVSGFPHARQVHRRPEDSHAARYARG